MNIVILTGNLGRDPEVKYAASGTAVANINLATTERVKGETKAEWHRLICFGKTAELASQYLSKGSKVGIQGKIQTRTWDKDGVKQHTTEIVVDRLEFLDSKPKSDNYTPPVSQDMAQGSQIPDDDIPF